MSIITLTTDFGLTDTFVAQMKGVILGVAPDVQIVDITHDIRPQHVIGGALALESAIDAFPDGTIHVGVVDPEVGTDRRAIAVRTARSFFVGPDNGLFSSVLEKEPLVEAVKLNRFEYFHQPVSSTFHGRDIFAPVAAHLAAGVPFEKLGDTVSHLVTLDLPRPRRVNGGIEVHVIHIDQFGNLVTDLRSTMFEKWCVSNVTITVGDHTIEGLANSFADVLPQEPVAYFGSSGRLEVSVRNGSAWNALGIGCGDSMIVKRA